MLVLSPNHLYYIHFSRSFQVEILYKKGEHFFMEPFILEILCPGIENGKFRLDHTGRRGPGSGLRHPPLRRPQAAEGKDPHLPLHCLRSGL